MAPRALLLSADEKVSALLSTTLASGTCKLDRSKDIFSAVEAITRDRFDLILIDWHEALEANFLLQTARDLKSNHSVFAVGLVTPAQGREALANGADAILVKPFTAEKAAEMLLPKLCDAAIPVAAKAQSAPVTNDPPPGLGKALAPKLPDIVPPAAESGEHEPPIAVPSTRRTHGSALQPSPPRHSGRSRVLSLTAIVWPVIIVAALVSFDQWPRISERTSPQLSGWLRAAHARVGKFVFRAEQPQTIVGDPLMVQPVDMPLTDDLLPDYSSPAKSAPIALEDDSSAETAHDIDFAAVEALPSSRRPIATLYTLEDSRPKVEIPASLRFPPRAETAAAVTPLGQLTAPDWSDAPIALPETVSRALLEHQVAPKYPEEALQTELDGQVVLQASIGKDGGVRELKLVSGYLVLAHAALDAVKQWRYKPYRRNGKNVEVETLITVNFKRPPRG
ncbi:MAG TPA: TonB family protein [Terriglobales bacterium]|nr:TonB family protein [Terriglobales bacterium]